MEITGAKELFIDSDNQVQYFVGSIKFDYKDTELLHEDIIEFSTCLESQISVNSEEMFDAGFKKGDEVIFGYFKDRIDEAGFEFIIGAEQLNKDSLAEMKEFFEEGSMDEVEEWFLEKFDLGERFVISYYTF